MRYILLLLTVFLIFDSASSAQPGQGPGGGRFRHRGGDPMKKLEELEKVKLIEALDLKEEAMLKLFSRRAEERKTMEERNDKADEFIDDLEDLVSDNKNGSNDSLITMKISEFHSFMEETQKLHHKFVRSLSDLLTPEQLGKYIAFERNFRRELRDLLKKD
jgi:hypothetical protein